MSVLTCENKTVATLHLDRPGQPRTSGIIREDQCLAVGTDPSNDICLIDDDVATTHCMIAARGGNVTVRDCFSAAGTFVDQVRIRELQLQTDAIIQIGRTKITVQLNRLSLFAEPGRRTTPIKYAARARVCSDFECTATRAGCGFS
jgi:pSer/pThr/pTyr-binding forkhead associated (FHA) protein